MFPVASVHIHCHDYDLLLVIPMFTKQFFVTCVYFQPLDHSLQTPITDQKRFYELDLPAKFARLSNFPHMLIALLHGIVY